MYGVFFFQAENGIRDAQESRGLGDVYKRQDLYHAHVTKGGKRQNAYEAVNDQAWYADTYIPSVAKRGAAVIEARGSSSAASAANAEADHDRS